MGSRSSLSRDVDSTDVDHWEMNYHEAAIFLEVGNATNQIEKSGKDSSRPHKET